MSFREYTDGIRVKLELGNVGDVQEEIRTLRKTSPKNLHLAPILPLPFSPDGWALSARWGEPSVADAISASEPPGICWP